MSKAYVVVRVLPKRLLGAGILPKEPSEAPPSPEQLVSLVVVGEAKTGKSSLVNSFMDHESLSLGDQKNSVESDASNRKWSVTYSKKDYVFCNNKNSLRSLRVQIWDTSGLSPLIPAADVERAKDWATVWKRASCILLTLSLKDSPDQILQKIKQWSRWLNNQCQMKPIVLILHQGDKLQESDNGIGNSLKFIQFGKMVSEICNSLRIRSWHITSSCLEDETVGNSIDTAFREILGDLGKSRSVPPHAVNQQCGTGSHSTATSVPTIPAVATTPERKQTSEFIRTVSPLT